MNRNAQERMMRYVDGEVDAEEAALVERWLAESEEARALLRDLAAVGAGVRAVAEDRAARSGDIADLVMARVGAEGPVSRTRVRAAGVVDIRRGRRVQAALPVVGLALAAAAAVFVFLRPAPRHAPVAGLERPSAVQSPEPLSATSSLAGDPAEPETGASIESVDFGAQNGTIFIVATGLQATPVVWLTDDGDPSSG